ncbi:MAG: roadblock/LC7 domain-containing protein [ANME-2 cluster archaeon]|nr:roadblock/LC7 domain-containing protein [ANME-2 cluster archaeon]
MTDGTLTELMELITDFKTMKCIEAVVVTSRSGINIASSVPPKTNPDTLAAMSSALQYAADILTGRAKKSFSDRVVIECERDKIIIVGTGPKALLLVLASEKSTLGPRFMEISNLSRQVKELLEYD